ncbi:YgiT-type zinc finger protein [Endozoicomonas euniceicola]
MCGEEAVRDSRPTEYTYKKHAITLDQPGTYCNFCGECILAKSL